mgnify:FL=1
MSTKTVSDREDPVIETRDQLIAAIAKGEKPKSKVDEDGKPLTKRGRREERARRQGLNQ